MQFVLNVEMLNAAFEEEPGRELARILREVADAVDFEVLRVPREGRGVRPVKGALYALVGPGDNAEPVITIMLPGED